MHYGYFMQFLQNAGTLHDTFLSLGKLRVWSVTTLYPNFRLISSSNNGVVVAILTHILIYIFWSFIIVLYFIRYCILKCINNKYLCQKQRILFEVRRIF